MKRIVYGPPVPPTTATLPAPIPVSASSADSTVAADALYGSAEVVALPKLSVNVPPVGPPAMVTACMLSARYPRLVTSTVSDRAGTVAGRVYALPPFVPTSTLAVGRLSASKYPATNESRAPTPAVGEPNAPVALLASLWNRSLLVTKIVLPLGS